MSRHGKTERLLQRTQRRQPLPGDIILVVCEGGKTEPGYFKGLLREWRLPALQVEVYGGDHGTAPISVVDYALELRQERRREARQGIKLNYDQVWCVIDHDDHESLKRAIDKARANGLRVALSVPSFEFWYLLHFIYTAQPMANSGVVIRGLKRHIQGYKKNESYLDLLFPRLDTAFGNAAKLRKDKEHTLRQNPSTDVDLLVRELKSLRRH